MSLCYYSTNPWIKTYISDKWRGGVHFVWCSDVFDPRAPGAGHYGSLIPPTSSPCEIYRDLDGAVGRKDGHNAKIISQKASILARAEQWRSAGEISEADADEIIYLASGDMHVWRPFVYVIPKGIIDPKRVELVPVAERAGLGDEFRIKDLRRHEFDWIRIDG